MADDDLKSVLLFLTNTHCSTFVNFNNKTNHTSLIASDTSMKKGEGGASNTTCVPPVERTQPDHRLQNGHGLTAGQLWAAGNAIPPLLTGPETERFSDYANLI